MTKSAQAPTKILRTVERRPRLRVVGEPPRRRKNADYRARGYLTEAEIERLMVTARKEGRYGQRDATAILLCYRLGLRVSELCALTWRHVNLDASMIYIVRRKGGKQSELPLTGTMLRALRQLRREWPDGTHLFQTERGGPMSPAGFAKMLTRVGPKAGIEAVHPHMLRHSCGYKLANDNVATRTIQGYLGHRSIQSTQRYTELSGTQFVGLWKD
jgi:type 1 fimbriae regulatory protein FimB/type 1 fimbriae regulatory protein FimE